MKIETPPGADAAPEPDMVRLLTVAGERVEHPDHPLDVTADDLRALYRDLVLVRRLDTEALALARQGELGAWPSLLGQEAAQVGSARALAPTDTAFPTYRDHGVAWCRGVAPADVLASFRGVAHSGWDPLRHRLHPYAIVIGSHTLHATGYAMGIQRDGTEEAAIAYFGDGATSEGDVNEAFVWAAAQNAPIVFFCQNNQWAISAPAERQSPIPLYRRAAGFGFPGIRVDGNDVLACLAVTRTALENARSGQGPTLIEAFTYRMGPHTTSDDPTRYREHAELETWRGRDPIARLRRHLERTGAGDAGFFADVDAEVADLGAELRRGCLALAEPAVDVIWEHVYATGHRQLGDESRAYLRGVPAGDDPVGPPPPAPAAVPSGTGDAAAGPRVWALSRAVNEGLRKAMEQDPTVLVMGEDVGRLGGVFRVTDGLQKDFGASRVIDTPLAESGIVGTAIGLALRGYRPVCEIQFDGFVFPAVNQITTQLARLRARTGGALELPVVIRVPFGGGVGAPEHHSESPEAYFTHTPGLRVVTCASPTDAYAMIQQAIACPDPVIFFEPKRRYWDRAPVETDLSRALPFDRAAVVREGHDVTVLTYGPMVKTCLEAAEVSGRSLEVVDVRSLSPLDEDTVLASVRRTGRCLVVHEAPVFSGFGAELAARVAERCFYHLEAPVERVGAFSAPYPPARVERHYLPSVDRILAAVDRTTAE